VGETERDSAIIIRVTVPLEVERVRRRSVASAALGVPAHVTVLFPFLPVGILSLADRAIVEDVVGRFAPFELSFGRVGRFPSAVYLLLEPAAPVVAMTRALNRRYPELRPYGARFRSIVPHLTISEDSADQPEDLAAALGSALPFRHRVTEVEVMAQSATGRWRPRWRLPLGVRP